MNGTDVGNEDKSFLLQLRMRAQQKAKEYADLLHERERLEVRIQRTKIYVDQLNNFLKAEGQDLIQVKASLPPSSVGKPGNRSKEFPVRKAHWEGLSVNEIIKRILNASPTISFHPKDVAPQIYEIQSESDLNMVYHNVRSTMQTGARAGHWERTGRAKFKAKTTVQQGELVRVA